MRIVDLIRRKRDGGELTAAEVEAIVAGYTRGDIPDYQMSAFLMAALLKKLTPAELAALTSSMLHSGQVLDFSDLPRKKVDKHSTGGVDALVLDVKTGSGAFMKSESDAIYLAQLMVETGQRMGKRMVALITDMSQPLGSLVGNALEVIECIDILRGHGPQDLRDLCLELAAWMFYLGEKTQSVAEGRKLSAALIANGAALAK